MNLIYTSCHNTNIKKNGQTYYGMQNHHCKYFGLQNITILGLKEFYRNKAFLLQFFQINKLQL